MFTSDDNGQLFPLSINRPGNELFMRWLPASVFKKINPKVGPERNIHRTLSSSLFISISACQLPAHKFSRAAAINSNSLLLFPPRHPVFFLAKRIHRSFPPLRTRTSFTETREIERSIWPLFSSFVQRDCGYSEFCSE